MLSFKSLQCFVTLVKTQSFTRTAEQLYLTQPTISKILQQLEQQLQVQLLVKPEHGRKRQVELTEIGQRVYQHALELLQSEQNIFLEIENYQQLKTGTLKLGVPPLGSQLLTTALFDYHQQWPEIELSFLEVGSKGIEQALLNNELDVGVLLHPFDEQIFNSIELCNYPLMVLLRRDATWATRKKINLEELQHQSFLMFPENFSLNRIILDACQQHGFYPSIACRTSQWNLLADMVLQRMGIALLPQYYTDMLDPDLFAAIPLEKPNIQWHLVMAWKKNLPVSPAVQAWLNVIRQHFQLIKSKIDE
ncbi:LysR substrate-binding domain-containing protein [Acinetobacter sp. NIPH 1958]|uniref:LysR family transcriptional regulator n=1 Tax=unclassified Acinetobacter TaxID=196816 RepID=UPI000517D6D4|nr:MULTISPECIES: LysR family transcriptional regulator [unclassified Acinetobacter]MCH7353162.1 LysR substrate-binding domain-containing protein [Acinetobacter sp. NIPH 2023]MCH7356843.1 LysR substrate-binding domain-containing protein [Acinetobacter sp. NIPH 1958]MCH7360596.1 LysR substrate-binding domain-containing protein [Acinetobacter sp. NIPH 2024]